ncbi:MAG: YfiM family protein [Candidatus Kapabacteria bacterium]|nr:YfiM family protein [Candidatus Kapabacteria bacterium]
MNTIRFHFILKAILIFLISCNYINAQTDSTDLTTSTSGNDSLQVDSCDPYAHLPRIDIKDFMIADNPRYTFTGELPFLETNIRPVRAAIAGGIVGTFYVTQHIIQVNTIWAETGKFRFIEDGDYALYSDKLGHFYGTYLASSLYTELFLWSGFSYDASVLWGSIMGIAYTAYVEIMDGFAADWGFSPSDFYSNSAGVAFHLLQHYVPFFQNFTPKFIYIPADWHGERKRQPSSMFIDDYSSHSLFMSINVENILPNNLKPYWPDWLQLSVGYSARNLCVPNDYDCNYNDSKYYNDWLAGSPRYIIALDYDFVKLLPDGPPFWNWFKQALNHVKFPAPAIEFGNGTRFMLLYPFLKLN